MCDLWYPLGEGGREGKFIRKGMAKSDTGCESTTKSDVTLCLHTHTMLQSVPILSVGGGGRGRGRGRGRGNVWCRQSEQKAVR